MIEEFLNSMKSNDKRSQHDNDEVDSMGSSNKSSRPDSDDVSKRSWLKGFCVDAIILILLARAPDSNKDRVSKAFYVFGDAVMKTKAFQGAATDY